MLNNVPVIGILNGKSRKDHLPRATLPKVNESRIRGKKLFVPWFFRYCYDVYDRSLSGNFKIQCSPWNCDFKTVLDSVKCKICDEPPYVKKATAKFPLGSIILKANITCLERVIKNFPYYLNGQSGIDDCNVLIFEQCKTHAQLKELETFR